MRELVVLLGMLLVLSGQAWAGTAITGARVTFLGQVGKPGPAQDVAAKPGVRFGLELVPEGSPPGSPLVLEVRLVRPGDSEDAPSMRWMVAARVGQPALCAWEFAYDWEVEPGVWTMAVTSESVPLASASFTVTRAEPQTQQPDRKAAEPVKDGKKSEAAPGKSDSGEGGKRAEPPAAQPAPQSKPAGPREGAGQQPQETKSEAKARPSQINLATAPVQGHPESATPSPQTKASPDEPGSARTKQPGQSNGKGAVNGQPDRRVYALIGGTYSEEGRALWMAALLKERGVKACVCFEQRGAKRLWSIVAGWRDSLEEAKAARQKLAPLVGDMVLVPMTAGKLEKGMQCR